jgi:hypothetical protein
VVAVRADANITKQRAVFTTFPPPVCCAGGAQGSKRR